MCEMCGGSDLIKQDGVFVCQSCGCKYSVEEARKMMVEGTVEVQGTVKVDNSAFVEKYLQNARRAKMKEDWEETEKYYNMVEQNDPSNIEAIFYSAYAKAKNSLIDSDFYKREATFKVLQNCVSIIDDNFDVEKDEENKIIIGNISKDIIEMACSNYVYNNRKNGYGSVIWSDKLDTINLFNKLEYEFIRTLDYISQKYNEDNKEKRVYYYKLVIEHANFIKKNGQLKNTRGIDSIISDHYHKIISIDPTYEIPKMVSRNGIYWNRPN